MELPPVIQIALDEELWNVESPQELRDVLIGQGLGEELSRQATWTLENFQYIDDREGGDFSGKVDYSFSPSGTLNPFSQYGKCETESCMAESTNDFIKSVGLYSEVAALPDPLSGLLAYDSISEAETNERLLRKLKVLGKVAPLVRSGLLKFGTPILLYCSEHRRQFEENINEAIESLNLLAPPTRRRCGTASLADPFSAFRCRCYNLIIIILLLNTRKSQSRRL